MRETAEMLDSDRAHRKLAEPLHGAVVLFARLAAAMLAIGFALALWSGNVTVLGFGRGPACTNVSLNGLSTIGTGNVLEGTRPGASSDLADVGVCVMQPSGGQRALGVLTSAPEALLYAAIVLLVLRLLVVVRRRGPFVVQVAARLRFLAWFVLAGSITASIIQHVAAGYLVATAIRQPVPIASDAIAAVVPTLLLALLVACGLLTLSRMMRAGARMQDDLAGTV